MNTKTTLPISKARNNIFKIADDVQAPGRYYTFTERGVPKVVMMSAEEFESWQETREVRKVFPDLKKDIAEARRDYEKGDYITLDELMAKNGYTVTKKRQK